MAGKSEEREVLVGDRKEAVWNTAAQYYRGEEGREV